MCRSTSKQLIAMGLYADCEEKLDDQDRALRPSMGF